MFKIIGRVQDSVSLDVFIIQTESGYEVASKYLLLGTPDYLDTLVKEGYTFHGVIDDLPDIRFEGKSIWSVVEVEFAAAVNKYGIEKQLTDAEVFHREHAANYPILNIREIADKFPAVVPAQAVLKEYPEFTDAELDDLLIKDRTTLNLAIQYAAKLNRFGPLNHITHPDALYKFSDLNFDDKGNRDITLIRKIVHRMSSPIELYLEWAMLNRAKNNGRDLNTTEILTEYFSKGFDGFSDRYSEINIVTWNTLSKKHQIEDLSGIGLHIVHKQPISETPTTPEPLYSIEDAVDGEIYTTELLTTPTSQLKARDAIIGVELVFPQENGEPTITIVLTSFSSFLIRGHERYDLPRAFEFTSGATKEVFGVSQLDAIGIARIENLRTLSEFAKTIKAKTVEYTDESSFTVLRQSGFSSAAAVHFIMSKPTTFDTDVDYSKAVNLKKVVRALSFDEGYDPQQIASGDSGTSVQNSYAPEVHKDTGEGLPVSFYSSLPICPLGCISSYIHSGLDALANNPDLPESDDVTDTVMAAIYARRIDSIMSGDVNIDLIAEGAELDSAGVVERIYPLLQTAYDAGSLLSNILRATLTEESASTEGVKVLRLKIPLSSSEDISFGGNPPCIEELLVYQSNKKLNVPKDLRKYQTIFAKLAPTILTVDRVGHQAVCNVKHYAHVNELEDVSVAGWGVGAAYMNRSLKANKTVYDALQKTRTALVDALIRYAETTPNLKEDKLTLREYRQGYAYVDACYIIGEICATMGRHLKAAPFGSDEAMLNVVLETGRTNTPLCGLLGLFELTGMPEDGYIMIEDLMERQEKCYREALESGPSSSGFDGWSTDSDNNNTAEDIEAIEMRNSYGDISVAKNYIKWFTVLQANTYEFLDSTLNASSTRVDDEGRVATHFCNVIVGDNRVYNLTARAIPRVMTDVLTLGYHKWFSRHIPLLLNYRFEAVKYQRATKRRLSILEFIEQEEARQAEESAKTGKEPLPVKALLQAFYSYSLKHTVDCNAARWPNTFKAFNTAAGRFVPCPELPEMNAESFQALDEYTLPGLYETSIWNYTIVNSKILAKINLSADDRQLPTLIEVASGSYLNKWADVLEGPDLPSPASTMIIPKKYAKSVAPVYSSSKLLPPVVIKSEVLSGNRLSDESYVSGIHQFTTYSTREIVFNKHKEPFQTLTDEDGFDVLVDNGVLMKCVAYVQDGVELYNLEPITINSPKDLVGVKHVSLNETSALIKDARNRIWRYIQ